jgi:hypothetical protein
MNGLPPGLIVRWLHADQGHIFAFKNPPIASGKKNPQLGARRSDTAETCFSLKGVLADRIPRTAGIQQEFRKTECSWNR